MKIYYRKQIQKKASNPFYPCVNQNYHDALRNELTAMQDYIMENISHWIFNGSNEERDVASWLLEIPENNHYGQSERGTKDGVNNSPASCLAGAVNKLRKGGPGKGDLSKNQIANLKRVITGLRQFDETKFREIEWVEQVDDNYEETPMQKIRKQLGGSTFNNIFEFST